MSRRLHARHPDGAADEQRAAERRAVRGVLVVPRLHLDRAALQHLHGAHRLEVSPPPPPAAPAPAPAPAPCRPATAVCVQVPGGEAQPAAAAVLRAVPQLRAATPARPLGRRRHTPPRRELAPRIYLSQYSQYCY